MSNLESRPSFFYGPDYGDKGKEVGPEGHSAYHACKYIMNAAFSPLIRPPHFSSCSTGPLQVFVVAIEQMSFLGSPITVGETTLASNIDCHHTATCCSGVSCLPGKATSH